jgi:hypothetical protein
LIFCEVIGHNKDESDFSEVGDLEADEAEVNPALSAVNANTYAWDHYYDEKKGCKNADVEGVFPEAFEVKETGEGEGAEAEEESDELFFEDVMFFNNKGLACACEHNQS